mmetsp:Transcript_62016/g.134487  ORF Transcript_62016/g.134487 Transcript_62016/m.134487 type:complete len:339 (+) Transcript_62016:41-1057(+)
MAPRRHPKVCHRSGALPVRWRAALVLLAAAAAAWPLGAALQLAFAAPGSSASSLASRDLFARGERDAGFSGAKVVAQPLRSRRQQEEAASRSTSTRRHAWGDPVDFFSATVEENVEAAAGLRLIRIAAPQEVIGPFQRAGQYVQARAGEEAKPSFYAISSPPGANSTLEFLIKDSESNAWIAATGKGDALQLSAAMGKGFDIDGEAWAGKVSQVNLFATGSGVAPIRSALEGGALAGKNCRLYYGAREESALAFAERFEDWKRAGVEVIPVLSKAPDSWSGRKGYVQAAFEEDEERGEGFVLSARHGALLCGQKEMVAQVRDVYAKLGVPEERTLLNF